MKRKGEGTADRQVLRGLITSPLVYHPLLKQKVCKAGSDSFLPLYVGEQLPVPAILKETLHTAVRACVCERERERANVYPL